MAKKRTGLDALREYEARSGRQTQSGNQQTGNAGSSGGTWRSGLDALREYEASGGGQNVRDTRMSAPSGTLTLCQPASSARA